MTIPMIKFFGTCNVRMQCIRQKFPCTKGLFNLSTGATINVFNASLFARCAIFTLMNKKVVFLEILSKDLYIRRDKKINSRCYWRFLSSNMPKRKVCSPFNLQNSSFYGCKTCNACSYVLVDPPKGPKTDNKVVWW